MKGSENCVAIRISTHTNIDINQSGMSILFVHYGSMSPRRSILDRTVLLFRILSPSRNRIAANRLVPNFCDCNSHQLLPTGRANMNQSGFNDQDVSGNPGYIHVPDASFPGLRRKESGAFNAPAQSGFHPTHSSRKAVATNSDLLSMSTPLPPASSAPTSSPCSSHSLRTGLLPSSLATLLSCMLSGGLDPT